MKKIKKQFTLVELLVVITILAVLMSLLQPALRSVLFKTKTTACASNLKQVGMSYLMYADDNNDFYPFAERKHNGPNGPIRNGGYDQYCDLKTFAGYRHHAPRVLQHGDHWNLKETLSPYLGSIQDVINFFKCPHMKGIHPTNPNSDYAIYPNISVGNKGYIGYDPKGDKSGIMRKLGGSWFTNTSKHRMFILAGDIAGSGFGVNWSSHGSLNDPGVPYSKNTLITWTRSTVTKITNGNFLLDDGAVLLRDRLLIGKWKVEMTGSSAFRVPTEFGEK